MWLEETMKRELLKQASGETDGTAEGSKTSELDVSRLF